MSGIGGGGPDAGDGVAGRRLGDAEPQTGNLSAVELDLLGVRLVKFTPVDGSAPRVYVSLLDIIYADKSVARTWSQKPEEAPDPGLLRPEILDALMLDVRRGEEFTSPEDKRNIWHILSRTLSLAEKMVVIQRVAHYAKGSFPCSPSEAVKHFFKILSGDDSIEVRTLPKSAPRRPKRPPIQPKRPPRRLQEGAQTRGPNGHFEPSAPRGPQEAPRGSQEAGKRPPGGPKRPHEAPRKPQEALKRPARGPQEAPERPQETTQELDKGAGS